MKLTPCIAFVFLLSNLSLSKRSVCEERVIDSSVPIIAVDLERAATAEEIEGALRGIGSPATRGEAMLERMNFIGRPSADFAKAVRVLFSKAQDNFFSGKHELADREFAQIIEKAQANPINVLSSSEVREIVFKSYVQRAVIAHEFGDEARVDTELLLAAGKFADLEPTSREFPPWVCDRFTEIRGEAKTDEGEIQMETSGLTHSKLLLRSGDLVLVPEGEAVADLLVKDAVALAQSGGWKRLVAIVGKNDAVEVWLIDADFFGVTRAGSGPLDEADAAEKAARTLTVDKPLGEEPSLKQAKRSWYKNSLAWAVASAGAAMLAAGFSLGMVYGNHSKMEPWAYTLYTAGGGALITGTVLFFVPPLPDAGMDESEGKSVAIGLTAVIPF